MDDRAYEFVRDFEILFPVPALDLRHLPDVVPRVGIGGKLRVFVFQQAISIRNVGSVLPERGGQATCVHRLSGYPIWVQRYVSSSGPRKVDPSGSVSVDRVLQGFVLGRID